MIKANIYKLFKDKYFHSTLFLCLVYTLILIYTSSKTMALFPVSGSEMLITSFLKNDVIVFLIIVLLSNTICSEYTFGIVKNIYGRGIDKFQYITSLVMTHFIVCIGAFSFYTVSLTVFSTVTTGFAGYEFKSYYIILYLIRILYIIAILYICAYASLFTKKHMMAVLLTLYTFFIPLTIQTLLSLVRIKVNLDFMKINYYFQLLTGEFNTAYVFKAVIVISAYLILAVFMNKKILNSSDVR